MSARCPECGDSIIVQDGDFPGQQAVSCFEYPSGCHFSIWWHKDGQPIDEYLRKLAHERRPNPPPSLERIGHLLRAGVPVAQLPQTVADDDIPF